MSSAPRGEVFHFVMIKPSHYDDEGYVIQWKVSSLSSNSLASIYGIAQDASERRPLGPDVEIRLEAYDESNTRIVPEEIAARLRGPERRILVALVGVQSNQFPRAVDLARRFLACGVKVCIGGFHVSGCAAMLEDTPPEIDESKLDLFTGDALSSSKQAVVAGRTGGPSGRSMSTQSKDVGFPAK